MGSGEWCRDPALTNGCSATLSSCSVLQGKATCPAAVGHGDRSPLISHFKTCAGNQATIGPGPLSAPAAQRVERPCAPGGLCAQLRVLTSQPHKDQRAKGQAERGPARGNTARACALRPLPPALLGAEEQRTPLGLAISSRRRGRGQGAPPELSM